MEYGLCRQTVVILGNGLHRNPDLEFTFKNKDFQIQGFVVFLDVGGPHGRTKLNALGLDVY